MFENILIDQDSDFKRYFAGKRVVIVGPAPYLVGMKSGKLFDSYDVVVRFNKSYPVPDHRKEDYGTRTDVLYHCMSQKSINGGTIHYNQMLREGTWLASPYPRELWPFDIDFRSFEQYKPEDLKMHACSKELFLEVEGILGSRPNTGFMGIIEIAGTQAASIDIFGMTFFQGNKNEPRYVKEYRDITHRQMIVNTEFGTHRQTPQIALFQKMLQNFDKIKIDDKLSSILHKGEKIAN